MKILANDGVSQSGIDKLKEAGYEVITTNVAQEQLQDYINKNENRFFKSLWNLYHANARNE
jgi:D-3-phosphoglycerate dehydrogenase